ncbi:GntR family transcriptional regulator [Oceanobacillus iheyensis]|uniref:GntR family transcriptional regulator n=1 Tax=Oceanobacillus iheyensis TaxID=182710 RepID=UPI00362BEDFE
MNVYDAIKNAIFSGELKQGQRLTETYLAEYFNVSRTPIRETLKQLISEGIVHPYKKKGIIVRSFSSEDIKEIYNVRALLEGYGTGEAALNRTEEQIARIEEKNKLYKEAIYHYNASDLNLTKNIQETNQDFHHEIFVASHNNQILELIDKVVVVPLIYRSFYWYKEEHLYQSLEVHNTILNSIKNKDIDRAKSAMQEHIYTGRDHVLKNVINK